jgi:putative transposase
MSRPANPYDNASCESFIKTLKREEIYANEYQDLDHLRSNIAEFIERYYNQKRLHSALGHRSPEEFEEQVGRDNFLTTTGATVRFVPPTEEKSSTLMIEEGTRTPSIPRLYPGSKN